MPDMERPLNKRGKDTCKFMAEHILKAGCSFENAFCSPALRAQSTIKKIAKEAEMIPRKHLAAKYPNYIPPGRGVHKQEQIRSRFDPLLLLRFLLG